MSGLRSGTLALVLATLMATYGLSLRLLDAYRPPRVAPELLIRLPVLVQVLAAAGDRYLAANMAGIRVLVAETQNMKGDDYAVQARLQDDVSWLNPAHEDNYYIAANLLPWNGEVEAAERVLRRATDSRPFDFLPAFHVGFIHYHFRRDPAEGARWLLKAAERASDQGDQWALQVVAAKWIERGYETATAANIVAGMARTAPPGGFRRYLNLRADRLHALDRLRVAAQAYRAKFGRPPADLGDLVVAGMLAELPKDPLGAGFVLDAKGEPQFGGRAR